MIWAITDYTNSVSLKAIPEKEKSLFLLITIYSLM